MRRDVEEAQFGADESAESAAEHIFGRRGGVEVKAAGLGGVENENGGGDAGHKPQVAAAVALPDAQVILLEKALQGDLILVLVGAVLSNELRHIV